MKTTREDVEDIMGDLDQLVLERIVAVGASKEELHEAVLAAVMEFELGEPITQLSSERVEQLTTIIEELLQSEVEVEDGGRDGGTRESGGEYDRW